MKVKSSDVERLKDQLAEKKQIIRTLRSQIAEFNSSFELRWEADRRAIKMWHAAHIDKTSIWPDQADLCIWLMDRVAEHERLLMLIVMAVCDPREAVKGNTPSYGKAVEQIIDKCQELAGRVAEQEQELGTRPLGIGKP